MKKLFGILLMVLLAGCSSTNQFALLKLSQNDLNQQLNTQLQQRLSPIKLSGVPLQFRSVQVENQIAPEGRSVIQLDLSAEIAAKVAVIQLPLQAAISIEAEPYFDQQRQGVYLRQFKLLDAKVASAGYSGQLKPLSTELQQWLQSWLTRQPVYQLDPNKLEHQLFLKMPLKIQLKPGQMVLTPAFN